MLNLSANGIGDEGAGALASSPGLQKLVRMELRWNVIGGEAQKAIVSRFGVGANVVPQRTPAASLVPPPPPPPKPAASLVPPPPKRVAKPVDRAKTLERLGKKKAFAAWRPATDGPIVAAAEAISSETIAALLALGHNTTRAAEKRILRRYVVRFDALDRKQHFVGTIEVEDIGTRFDEIRSATTLADDDELFDEWRDF